MDDAILLGKAAKAADIRLAWSSLPGSTPRNATTWETWNPLGDDGDALRLAVRLHLWEAVRLAHRLVGLPECPDIYAATRRSIVMAAAALVL